MSEAIIYELSAPGRCAAHLPRLDVPAAEPLPDALLRSELELPEVSESDLVRHYVRLSQLNYAVDIGMYPLGSCTMKYNPKVHEDIARLAGFAEVHPYLPEELSQGCLQLMFALQQYLAAITGFEAVSLQPAAGAQGELSGVLMIRAYHRARGDTARTRMLIPDTAHGTNPASTVMVGLEMVQVSSDARGNIDLNDLSAKLDDTIAGMMLTNPNTLGLFDEHILEVTRLVHASGGLIYGDGANLNALMGIAKPAELGFDVMHLNLHKTFSTPHGGGGPGSGPVAARADLAQFLPGPIVTAHEAVYSALSGEALDIDADDPVADAPQYMRSLMCRLEMPEHSIGRIKSFYGQFGILVRAYTYIRMLGEEGLRATSEAAVLAANYIQASLRDTLPLPYDRLCMHECVFEGRVNGAEDIHALDISKRMIDYGIHPPTNYFPLVVPEALMIEPTETESKRSLDAFIQIVKAITEEAKKEPELLRTAPHRAPVGRLDEVQAARKLILRWQPEP
ncbi:MAG: aminomethyl-transferring glycine dehydrogenase subunit GcvPB [Chloroflexi bacterium]|nr:aminomethyl-transferring glycine dehydrogenase subunit GcvPB [Chloroflexota bacterium]